VFGDYGYGEAWGREGLELRVRSFVTMAVLQSLHENDQLHLHVNNALNLGITPEEIHEAIAQTGLYAGVSGWNNATFVVRDVFVRRGIIDTPAS
jgi:4-carboxymuconolactone decarboxylase